MLNDSKSFDKFVKYALALQDHGPTAISLPHFFAKVVNITSTGKIST